MKRTRDSRDNDTLALNARFDEDRGLPNPLPSSTSSSTSSSAQRQPPPIPANVPTPSRHNPQKTPQSHQSGSKAVESDAHRLDQREKQIFKGKNTLGYARYTAAIPRNQRKKDDPRTPPLHHSMSKRAWDGLYKIWRRQLHEWDLTSKDPAPGKAEEQKLAEKVEAAVHTRTSPRKIAPISATASQSESARPPSPVKAAADDELEDIERQLREIENLNE